MAWHTWAARAIAWRAPRSVAWGLRLGRREAALVALSRRSGADVRVLMFQRWRAPEDLQQAQAIDAWLAQAVLASSAQVPASERHLMLALSASRCQEGELTVSAAVPIRQRLKHVRAHVAQQCGDAAEAWAVDMQPHAEPGEDADIETRVRWAACPQSMLDQWCDLARRAAWRLDAVEPHSQAHARALTHALQEPHVHAVDSPQDWRFAPRPQRATLLAPFKSSEPEETHDAAREKLLIACGAALGAWA